MLFRSLQDVLIRFERMRGKAALWLPGTDHAGIATQMVVERQLAAAGNQSRRDMGREAFIEKVWEWKAESGGTITNQLRRLGASCDWSRERFTLDKGLNDAVTKVFVELYQEGLIYRDKRLVNWDPQFQTAISDLEVETREVKGHFWHLRYPLADGSTYKFPIAFDEAGKATEWEDRDYIVVATTRPETMLGDTAVAVHPTDERYAGIVGKQVKLPLTGRLIPIVADEYADPTKGTGAVKITPAHDFNDYQVGKRHKLPMINILTDDAHLNAETPEAYRGLERFAARKKVVADIELLGLLHAIEDTKIQQPFGDRSQVVIEPYLTDQWYVDAATLAKVIPLMRPRVRNWKEIPSAAYLFNEDFPVDAAAQEKVLGAPGAKELIAAAPDAAFFACDVRGMGDSQPDTPQMALAAGERITAGHG